MRLKPSEPAGAYRKLIVGAAAAAVVGTLTGIFGSVKIVPLAAWDSVAVIYAAWTWLSIWPMTAERTKKMAKREDPGRGITDIILNFASLASLLAVGLILVEGSSGSGLGKGMYASFGVISVILSWLVIHTLYTLKYAELYYQAAGGVDFNQAAAPRYSDFAYLAFTVGMTFQVSDTSIKSNQIRRAVLHQAQLSYFFGTIIIATTINLVVGLSK